MGGAFRDFAAHALARKPLRLVREQAHLGDGDSRYESPRLVSPSLGATATSTSGEDTGEWMGAGGMGGGAGPLAPPDTGNGGEDADGSPKEREAPLRHMSLFDLVGEICLFIFICCNSCSCVLLERSFLAPFRKAFGIGTTIGSGVFVLAGLAAREYAGPSSAISYLVAGFVAALSGLPYAELSAAFPVDGSTYAVSCTSRRTRPLGRSYIHLCTSSRPVKIKFAYITLGEVFAVIASLCQTLEYGIAGAAVARSWGEQVRRLDE